MSMKIIQITNTYKGDVLKIVRDCTPEGFGVRTLPENTKEALVKNLADADYLLASGRLKIDAEVLEHAPNLKMIQRTGVGLDSLDLKEIHRRNIPLYVNGGVNADSVAEHAILLMLACLRRLPETSGNTKAGRWIKQAQGVKTRELGSCTVGLIGMGNIGRTVVRLLHAFGATVLYYDPWRLSEEKEKEQDITYCTLDELFGQSDLISLHCPLTEETSGMINAESIGKMKDGVIIVNTARGKLIREEDLLSALESQKVSFAGLDVFEQEPPEHMALLQHDRVIATPHIAGVTYDSFYRMMHDAMRNIRLFEEGRLREIEPYLLKTGEQN